MVNLEKYKNNGWGLSKLCLKYIEQLLKENKKIKNGNFLNVVEFGSGISTRFLVDLINDGYNLNIISYDDNPNYIPTISHKNLKIYIKKLIECDDINFKKQFQTKKYNSNYFNIKNSPIHTRQKNCFYDIKENELPDIIDVMIVDGPHGNGRNIAFLHAIDKLKSGSIVIIDDYNHYDFLERFKMLFPQSKKIIESNTGRENQWEMGGVFVIMEVL